MAKNDFDNRAALAEKVVKSLDAEAIKELAAGYLRGAYESDERFQEDWHKHMGRPVGTTWL
jgi:hypothetical protein